MDRTKAAIAGLVVAVAIFGVATVTRIVARLVFALSYLLEAVGVLAFAVFLGWLAYRVLAGDANDPRSIQHSRELDAE